jgi:hypothetical protein
VIPLSKGITKVWPESIHLVALPQGCQVTITSPLQAVFICISVIKSIASERISLTADTLDSSGRSSNHLWAIESCSRLWPHYQRLKGQLEPNDDDSVFESSFLTMLNSFCFLPFETSRPRWTVQRSVPLLIEVYSSITLNFRTEQPSEMLQRTTASGLIRFLWVIITSQNCGPIDDRRDLRHDFEGLGSFEGTLCDIVKERTLFQSLINPLRASTYIATLSLQAYHYLGSHIFVARPSGLFQHRYGELRARPR